MMQVGVNRSSGSALGALDRSNFMSSKQPKRNPRPGVDEYGRIPLHHAAVDGDFDALIQLLDSGSIVDAQDDNGWTALHFAAQGGHFKMVEELLKRGANLKLVNCHGNGPLWVGLMSSRGDFTIVKMLLAAGADPDCKNAHGRSPRDIATTMGVSEAIAL
jgi:ankyrin repeat protein